MEQNEDVKGKQRPFVRPDSHHRMREAAGALHLTVVDAYELSSIVLKSAARHVTAKNLGNIEALAAEIEGLLSK